MNRLKNRDWFVPVLLVVISLVGIWSLFQPGFFTSHDGEWMVVRLSDFHRSLADGQIPVRWAGRLNFGNGYPVFDFLYPGTFYFAELFHLLRFNFIDSVKIAFGVSFVFSGLFMYWFLKKLHNRAAGLAGAVLYMFTPYRFVDLYVRGSLGESVAFMFPPLIAWCWLNFVANIKHRWVWGSLTSFALAGLIMTHNVTAYLFLPLLFCFALISRSESNLKMLRNLLFIFSAGFCLSAFFWLPALWDKQFTIFDRVVVASYQENYPSVTELILPSWNYGPSRPGDSSSLSFQIGVVNLTVVLFSALFFWLGRKNRKKKDTYTLFFLTVTLMYGFLLIRASEILWKVIPLLPVIQFPWRILSVTTFSTSVLAAIFLSGFNPPSRKSPAARPKDTEIFFRFCGFSLTKAQVKNPPPLIREIFKNNSLNILTAVLILAAILFNFSYARPDKTVNREEGYYTTNDDTTTVQGEYLPVGATSFRQRANNKVEVNDNAGSVSEIVSKSNYLTFSFSGREATAKINTVYFPGWKAEVDGVPQKIVVDSQGLITLRLSPGEHNVKVVFTETKVRLLADLLSAATFLILSVILLKSI